MPRFIELEDPTYQDDTPMFINVENVESVFIEQTEDDKWHIVAEVMHNVRYTSRTYERFGDARMAFNKVAYQLRATTMMEGNLHINAHYAKAR